MKINCVIIKSDKVINTIRKKFINKLVCLEDGVCSKGKGRK